MPTRTIGFLALSILCWQPALGRAAKPPEGLDKTLLREASNLLTYAREHGYQTIGVLKFQVKKGAEPPTDNAGPLNLSLAHRLELALILANDVNHEVKLVRRASAVAAGLEGANHLTVEGRKRLFQKRYRLAWGKEESPVTPDAFFTGEVETIPGLKRMKVRISCFDKGSELNALPAFEVATCADDLVQIGESFLLRGGTLDAKGVRRDDQVIATVTSPRRDFPLDPRLAPEKRPPVDLEVRYDDKPVRLRIENGRARVQEPQKGQEVSFVLRRTPAAGRQRLAVVLKVNGENTIGRERQKDPLCMKWVLEPGSRDLTILGFQKDNKTASKFEVLSKEASVKDAINYGEYVGTISLVVFQERKEKVPSQPTGPALLAVEERAVEEEVYPSGTPMNLGALKNQLRAKGTTTKGIIGPSKDIPFKVEDVKFDLDPVAVQSAVITYYKH